MFRTPKPVSMALNLAPMVDVMMCLIIFFLLASKLVDAESQPIELPFAAAAQEVERTDLGTRVVLNVRRAHDSDEVAEYVVIDWDGQRVIERVLPPEQIETYLKARAAATDGEIRCVIRADREVMYQHVELVLRGCGLAKIANIVFSANAGVDPEEEEAT
ncbi:MAG: biopolymer transporter ExbD [Planctomycetes bacterium]|nr:biopolymer transporter ExbD [Planctomycetota bacterium]